MIGTAIVATALYFGSDNKSSSKVVLKEIPTAIINKILSGNVAIDKSSDFEENDSAKKDELSNKTLTDSKDIIDNKNKDSVKAIITSLPKVSTNKTWVPPVYKTVHHPAEIKKKKKLVEIICQPSTCGKRFASYAKWQEHRPEI